MGNYIIRRLLLLIPTLLIVTVIVFATVRLIPGDAVDVLMAQTGGGGGATEDAREIAGVAFVGRSLDGARPKELRAMVDDLKSRMGSGVYAVVSRTDGKAALTVGVSDDLTARVSAVDLARAGAAAVGGKGGGGRADMAQAGGPDGERLDDVLKAIEKALADAA